MTTVAAPAKIDAQAGAVRAAYRWLLIAVIFDFLAFGVGFSWDRQWHLTHPFEDFFSPPHLFIYTMHFIATMALAYVAFTPALREAFGPSFRLFPLPFPVPGAIALAGGGFVVTALAGFFDSVWHNAFGLDETLWSFPHAMLGAGIFVAFVGIAACRWALRDVRSIGLGSEIAFGFLLMASAAERFTGPIGSNLSPGFIQFVANIPVLALEPEFQHKARVELAFNLDRLNPLFVPLQSLSAGMALALVRAFVSRTWVFAGLTLLATNMTTWVPLIVPGGYISIFGRRAPSRVVWFVSGALFAIVTAIVWRGTFGSVVLGALLFPVGVWIGRRIWDIVERPTRAPVLTFVILMGIVYPAMTGIVDLSLRARVP